MKARKHAFPLLSLILLPCFPVARAETLYVWTNSPAEAPPYTNWHTAAHAIQDAADQVSGGDTILVTNGVYDSGEAITPGGTLPARVVISGDITLRSVNGPEVTEIRGQGPDGTNAVRGVYVSGLALVSGFTITNGHVKTEGMHIQDREGGGVYFGGDGTLSNCVIRDCGGSGICMYQDGVVVDSLIQNNIGVFGGGVDSQNGGTLTRCRIINNTALSAG
ncbi:MAG: right-handed parallel beta-helix repeat-containing protein, partial [Verrucomicrobia bacterium]|nr:right-handed parallel beta-helix repeat-containing protein [Verrucomicrobiota bacterium]